MVQRSKPTESVPDFTPVPRRERHDGWTPERQREFIAALAELGSVSGACRRVAMAVFGAYALRRAAGAESFRAAWKQALDMGAQRLADIAMDRAIEGVPIPIMYHGEQVAERRHYNDRLLTFMLQHHQPETYGHNGALRPGVRSARLDELEAADELRDEHVEAMGGIAHKLTMCRRFLLATIEPDAAKRAAWEVLVGPVDWDKAKNMRRQDDEPHPADPAFEHGLPNMREPDMVLVAESGMLGEYTGGFDALAAIREAVEKLEAEGGEAVDAEYAELTPEEQAALDAHHASLIAEGWTEDADGNLWSPDPTA